MNTLSFACIDKTLFLYIVDECRFTAAASLQAWWTKSVAADSILVVQMAPQALLDSTMIGVLASAALSQPPQKLYCDCSAAQQHHLVQLGLESIFHFGCPDVPGPAAWAPIEAIHMDKQAAKAQVEDAHLALGKLKDGDMSGFRTLMSALKSKRT